MLVMRWSWTIAADSTHDIKLLYALTSYNAWRYRHQGRFIRKSVYILCVHVRTTSTEIPNAVWLKMCLHVPEMLLETKKTALLPYCKLLWNVQHIHLIKSICLNPCKHCLQHHSTCKLNVFLSTWRVGMHEAPHTHYVNDNHPESQTVSAPRWP